MVRLAPLALLLAGCPQIDFELPPAPPPPPPDDAPWFDDIEVADYPPIGPLAGVTLRMRDDHGLARLDYGFRHTGSHYLAGPSADVTLTGDQLGEGLGTLDVIVSDTRGGWEQTAVDGLLVDLTPPAIYPGDTLLARRADGELELYVADAWVLGWVEVEVGGLGLRQDFPAVYPPTLGNDWDYSRVHLAIGSLADGVWPVDVRAADAAGNQTWLTYAITIDGTAPALALLAPAADQVVRGELIVDATAVDGDGGPAWVDITLGGAPVASAAGPAVHVAIDTADLGPGQYLLELCARDAAGNRSETVAVPVVIDSAGGE